ncbi:L-histidine N(alpha)-methyltransferase [Methylobacterium sp. WL103]|uniref:L-histidine N(alpha)-methyltransferase n=1 Tax=unclassified Methylobacterium TaxID=2615210 RepID=UPI0011CB236E|nr:MULTISPECIES: L-histidine N(alpha)-methyltransferase [unclassified Methylobacterium]TXM75956.1 L-histidine N(alpha)-methyltransferase [Methylobacterium sp. WL12]TXM95883.1 L-histidine N(alpha)-methyltransferase [Methylobacterium sp. WL103]
MTPEETAERDAFLRATLAGLGQTPKRLPGKYLWDEAGSILFDRICDHPDYYPTRREMALLPQAVPEIATLVGPGATIVEYGSGASRKIRTLLDGLDRPRRYVAIDISRDYLETSVRTLAQDYPEIAMIPVCSDYAEPIRLPVDLADGPVLGFFPGTSIGNLAPAEAEAFLARARDTLGPSHLLVGADPTQDADRLQRVYGGCDGLMPALHLNYIGRLNRELDAGIDRDAFRHEIRILRDPLRVEAHLVAARADTWHLGTDAVHFAAGESVRTDVSHKHSPDVFQALAGRAGWTPKNVWLDPDGLFSLHLLSR